MFKRIIRYAARRLAPELRRIDEKFQMARLEKLRNSFRTCGNAVRIHPPCQVVVPEQVSLGDNVHLGGNAFIRADGGLFVGDNTHISRNLVLYTVNHRYKDGQALPYDSDLVEKPVRIGRNVWIGMNVCVAPGTSIGDGAVIGMGAVVSGEVAPLSVVAAQPVRLVGSRDQEHYQRLEEMQAFGGANGVRIGDVASICDDHSNEESKTFPTVS